MKASSVHSRWQAAALAGAERELAPAPGPVSTEATSGAAAEYRTASRLDPRGPARLRSPWLTTATAAIRTKLAIAALAPLPYPQSLEDPCPIERLWQDWIAMQVSGDVVPVLRRAKLLPAQALGASEALRLSPLAAVPCLPWLRRTTIGPFLGRHDTLSADKDVDGFHIHNLGSLLTLFPPCTPYGIKSLLDHMQIPIEGQNAVVVGRSTIVGKPMALMLLQKGATVTVCTLKTSDLAAYTRLADILVVAAGKPNLNTATMVKEGAAVIDVGIDWAPDGRLVGDVDFDGVLGRPATLRPCRVGSVR